MPVHVRLLPVVVAACVAGWAGPLVVHESFRPIAARHTLTGSAASATVDVPVRQPMVLEYELVVHAADQRRPRVTARWNDRDVPLPPSPPFATSRALVVLPLETTVAGANVLTVGLDDPSAGDFEMRARLLNYRGIAPDPPRAYIVPPEARRERARLMSWPGRLVRAGGLALLTGLLAFALTRAGTAGAATPASTSAALVAGPSVAAIAGLAGPWHVWVAPETYTLLVVVPWLGLRLVQVVARHRVAALGWAVMMLVSLAGVEIALRLVQAVRPSFVFYAADASRFRGQPGAPFFGDTFNSRGFNDRERQVGAPPPGTYRVVAIGDSFAVGVVPRRNNYLARLEALLGERGAAEVVNVGVSATEPRDYLALLADEGLAYAPDVVLVGFYVGNDFETRAPRWHERSYAATLARVLWRLGRSPRPAATVDPAAGVFDDAAPGMSLERYLEIEVDRAWIFERDSARFREAVTRATRLVTGMQQVARRGGASLVVAVLPAEAQVDAVHQRRLAGVLGRPEGALDFEQPSRALVAALTAAGVDTVDLTPAFVERATDGVLYKPQDSHWNVAGNALAAEVLRPALERHRAIGRTP